MAKTKISWATDVWNPVTGCTKVSDGCKNCYAERIAKRFWRNGINGNNYRPFTEVRCYPDRLEQPLHWKKPARIFVDSMGDLFHEKVRHSFISQVFWIMEMAPKHIFIVLTKRSKRMHEWMNNCYPTPLPNVWLGVSVEDQKTADERIPWLLKTPAAVRIVSVEPMLGKVDVSKYLWPVFWHWDGNFRNPEEALAAGAYAEQKPQGLISVDRKFIDWIICGCESGPEARSMELDWARNLRDQCRAAEVPFFLKQANIDGKLVKMPAIDGEIWDKYPIIDNNYIENR